MASRSQSTMVVRAEDLVAGAQKHFASATSLAFAGASFTPAQVQANLQSLITLLTDVDTAKATTKAKLAAVKLQAPALRTFVAAFESFVRATVGNAPDVLADFGLAPKKARKPLTVEQKAAAAAKRDATRAARGTKGSQQKKAVKGDVTGVVVTPITSATTPAKPASPSTPTTGATAGTAPHTA
jgi:hypothetical protein